jgi:hypothetical protein
MALRTISLSAQRNFSSVTAATIGTNIVAVQVGAALLGGVFLQPGKFTPAVAVRRAINVYVLVNPAANSAVDGQHVVLQLASTRVNANGTFTNASFNVTWPIPAAWTTNDTNLVLLDNGNGHSFNPLTFVDQTTFALRVARVGSDPADTFAQSLKLAEAVTVEYTTREWSVIV